jgi:two-component system cell cycle response regulator DivK
MSRLVLVVEDQEDNRQILRDLLNNADYEMTEAETGEEAIAAVARQRPGLILMDIQLPGMDGYEATRRIKADPALSSIPIIAVTSYALSGDEDKCREAGCDGYVSKPYSPRSSWQRFVSSCLSASVPALECSRRQGNRRTWYACRPCAN